MAHKIKPTALRVGITQAWSSRWFISKKKNYFIAEDYTIRKVVNEKIKAAGIASIDIERTNDSIRISAKVARPGLVIGRGGKGVEILKDTIVKTLVKRRMKNNIPGAVHVQLNIEELKRTEVASRVVAEQIAADIEKRMPFRTVMKHHLENLKQNREVLGAKLKLSGRLNGAEISRTDWLAHGRMPLQTLRANIDYGEATSFNTYGTVGVKVWIYKGDIFAEKQGKGKPKTGTR